MSDDLILSGMRVLDVSTWIAAPSCAAMLADRGADVIKVEPPQVGDAYRGYYQLPPGPNAEINYTWALDNRNKRSICLNLKSAAGMAVLHKLIADCDIYITNQPLPFRREQHLLYEDLKALNPSLIYASITAYGEEGPERDREGFDLVGYWSRSGLMHQMRHQGTEPFQAMAGMGDHPTAVALYGSIMTALLQRERTGEGAKVHTSLLANGLWSSSCFAQAAWADADFSQIPGQRLTTALYLTSDQRWIQFSMVRSEELFDRMVLAMDRAEWLADPRFDTLEKRLEHHVELTAMIRVVMAGKTAAEWMAIFVAADVPAALVAEFEDLPSDPQVLANDMAMPAVDDIGMTHVVRDPVNVDGLGRVGATKAPEMGEHSAQILAELGYSADEIADMAGQGII
ncbi:MAG: CoA transferase [Pseudomonadota bacterium]